MNTTHANQTADSSTTVESTLPTPAPLEYEYGIRSRHNGIVVRDVDATR